MAGDSTQGWREPSMLDVAKETIRAGFPEGGRGLVMAVALGLAVIGIAVSMPPLDLGASLSFWASLFIVEVILAAQAARHQWRLGRPMSRILTAVIASVAQIVPMFLAFVVVNRLFGADRWPSAPGSLFDGPLGLVQIEFVYIGLTLLAVAILIKLIRNQSRWEDLAAADRSRRKAQEAEYQAERHARAAAARQAASQATDR